MLIFYIIILFLALYGSSFVKSGFNQDYLGKEQCNAIKGIFILVVFIRHIWPYLRDFGYDFSSLGDGIFMKIDRCMGQLIVVAFLFYSGYGVMESIKYKGKQYLFAMNGQTKEFIGDIPVDKKKVVIVSIICLIVIAAIVLGLSYLIFNVTK